MKLLIVGIDGCDEYIIRSMPMPFFHSLLNSCRKIEIKEDLWSRGWVEILSGYHGRESGAFYNKPLLNGSRNFIQHFGTEDFYKNPMIVPLWQLAQDYGYSIGFMNVPCTFPAPKIDQGFFVSGAGGGLRVESIDRLPSEGVYPSEAAKILLDKKYIFDVRLMSSGIRDINVYIETLSIMTKRRTSIYIELIHKFKPFIGFIAYMCLNRIQNIAMSEIESLIKNRCRPANLFQQRIIDLYKLFDDELKRLFEAISPKHFIITADHGQVPFLYTININMLLKEMGILKTVSNNKKEVIRRTKNLVKRILRTLFPPEIRFKIFKNRLNLILPLRIIPDWSSSLAFGVRYVPGIYINDSRFNGPVKDSEIESLVKDLITTINERDEFKKHSLRAIPYRKVYSKSFFNSLLPDIWIEHPDVYFFVEYGPVVGKNIEYGPIHSLWQITRDMYTGIKGYNPLVLLDIELSKYIDEKDSNDLTSIYHIVRRVIS